MHTTTKEIQVLKFFFRFNLRLTRFSYWFIFIVFGECAWPFMVCITRPKCLVNNYLWRSKGRDCDAGHSTCHSLPSHCIKGLKTRRKPGIKRFIVPFSYSRMPINYVGPVTRVRDYPPFQLPELWNEKRRKMKRSFSFFSLSLSPIKISIHGTESASRLHRSRRC